LWDIIISGERFNARNDSEGQGSKLHVKLDTVHSHFNDENAKQALYCMPGRARRDGEGTIYILLLEAISGERGTFRRIGLGLGWGADVQTKILARSLDERKLPCKEYTEKGHLIRIV
jgi:hypothetical protein